MFATNKPPGERVFEQGVSYSCLESYMLPSWNSRATFMVKIGVEKFDPESRKLIRSHVMMGKNLGKKLEKPRSPMGARSGLHL
jgi:hypothetical protein